MNKTVASQTNQGVGRRKSAVARVWLKPGKGAIVVNGKDYKEYFDTDITRTDVAFPFKVCGVERNFDAKITVSGGGLVGQSGAVQLGISRALLDSNEGFRASLRQHDLLTVDSRLKERKKYGQKGARKKFQFVKR
jgi:small subunit ribosomal protein S9